MQSDKVLWTKRNLEKSFSQDKVAVEFINGVQDSIHNFDLSSLARELLELPELNNHRQNFSELSDPAKKLFEKIYSINGKDPENGLKVITILACASVCNFYKPKLLETVFRRLDDWLRSDKLPLRTRLEWGIYCWKNWPVRNSDYNHNIFVDPLMKLFIEESKIDTDYTLKIYDSLFERRGSDTYIFNQFREDPEDFLQFSRNVQHIRPKFLTNALMKFISDGKKGYGDYSPDIGNLRSACNELFEITENNQALTEQELELIYRELTLYSYPDLPWYNKLHGLLWDIEKRKAAENKLIRNHLVVSVNCPKRSNLVEEIKESYRDWLTVYKTTGWLSVKNVVNHTKEMLEQISRALNVEYPATRNRSISEPNNDELIEDSITEYWSMIDYLKHEDIELYLYALETALEKPTFTVRITEQIGDESRHLLLSIFEEYCIDNIDKAALLVKYMISRSAYTEIGKNIGEALDVIFPVLSSISKETAESCYREGTKGIIGHSRMGLWRPKTRY